MKTIFALILSSLMIPAAFGFDANAYLLVGYGNYNEKAGAEVGLGVKMKPAEWIALDIAPITGILSRKDDPRYSREKDEDKQLNCRDNTNGQYVDKKYCGANFRYAFQSSLTVKPLSFLELGGGARVADRTLVYGLVAVKFTDSFSLEGKLGDEYSSAVFRCDF